MSKEIETIIIDSYVDMYDPEFNAPPNYYIINSLGDRVFIITRSRAKATQHITDNYGKGFFKLRTMMILSEVGCARQWSKRVKNKMLDLL